MKILNTILFAAALLAAAPGCSTTKYGDPRAPETINKDYGATDKQTFARDMVQSLKDAPGLAYLDHSGKGADKRIIVFTGGIENRTSEHIDTSGISDSIRKELLQSGKFRFAADPGGQKEIQDQVGFQNSGWVSPDMAKQKGKQVGADVVLYGVLRSIEKERRRSIETFGQKTEYVYYSLVYNCVNIETGELLWTEESELTKTQKTGLLGS